MKKVKLNVGGQLFKVSFDLLKTSSDFFDCCLTENFEFNEEVNVDRSPVLFANILDFLNNRYNGNPDEFFISELDFYGIENNLSTKKESQKSLCVSGMFGPNRRIVLHDQRVESNYTLKNLYIVFKDFPEYINTEFGFGPNKLIDYMICYFEIEVGGHIELRLDNDQINIYKQKSKITLENKSSSTSNRQETQSCIFTIKDLDIKVKKDNFLRCVFDSKQINGFAMFDLQVSSFIDIEV